MSDYETDYEMVKPLYSAIAEQSVLGSLMMDNQTWDVISESLDATDFYQRNHQVIFSVIKKLSVTMSPFDLVTMSDELKSINELDNVGGMAYLARIAEDTPTAKNITGYADIVKDYSIRRKIKAAGIALEQLADDKDLSILEIISESERGLSEIGTKSDNGRLKTDSIKTSLARVVSELESRFNGDSGTGLKTGITDLDDLIGGLKPSTLTVLAGRPGMGKTAGMLRIVEEAAKNDGVVLVFSMEMSTDSLSERMLQSIGRVSGEKMKRADFDDSDWSRIAAATAVISGRKIIFCDSSAMSLAEMNAVIRRTNREHGKIDLIAIDYLQLATAKSTSETHRVGIISEGMLKIAKDFNVAVLALSQLNRDCEKRADKRPQMSDLRQSGQIEQDAHLIIFMYRDEEYNKDSDDKGIVELIVAKQRAGKTGMVKAAFIGDYTRVENLQHNF
jgi:replicative DNA helicase